MSLPLDVYPFNLVIDRVSGGAVAQEVDQVILYLEGHMVRNPASPSSMSKYP